MTETTGRILIVDDDRLVLDSLVELLRHDGHTVDGLTSVRDALRALRDHDYALVITDINLPTSDGFELLRYLREHAPDTAAIVITAYGTIESAVEAIRMGAYDYLTKPIVDDELRLLVNRVMQQHALLRENRSLRRQLDERYSLDSIIGHDHRMQKIFDLIDAVADSRTTVLLQGESGTGKSLIARAIHRLSSRADGPFVEVSCGALPESLLESELFGHVRGAFTGALHDKIGKFEAAHGGTIFLDEISSASPVLQVKLLRVLQERQFEPVGSNETRTVDVRVILASNRDLAEEVRTGRFRQDLFYRVNVVTLVIPPLRERVGDIPLLAEHFLRKYAGENNRRIVGFSDDALRLLQRYNWPGNVRELENAVERAVVLCRGALITPDDLPPTVVEPLDLPPDDFPREPLPLKKALELPEKRIIEQALRANNWNRQATARMLGINRTTLYKKMRRYGLEGDPATSR